MDDQEDVGDHTEAAWSQVNEPQRSLKSESASVWPKCDVRHRHFAHYGGTFQKRSVVQRISQADRLEGVVLRLRRAIGLQ